LPPLALIFSRPRPHRYPHSFPTRRSSDLLSFAHHLMGDHRRELKAAVEGRRRHPEELAVLAAEVRALAALGRVADIEQRLVEAPSLPPQPGWSPADIGLLAALELTAHDHHAEALAAGTWAVRWLEGRPAT